MTERRLAVAWTVGLPAVICYAWVGRRARFALGLAALLVAGSLHAGPAGRPLHQERTFFGVLRVTVDPEGRFHQLVHGRTVHGRQRREGGGPLSYYHPGGPVGDVFARLPARATARRVAVIGLGAGSLCAYARPGEDWVFYEINAAVERIARNPAFFTFWRDCRAGRRDVELGDARLRLAAAPDRQFDALVVDAFSSDAIPVHLVTREALALYRRKTAPGGWIVFHVSSRYVELGPPLAALARDAGWTALARDDLRLSPEERAQGKDPSRWLVMAATAADLATLARDGRWYRPVAVPDARVWTDDFSNLWSVLRWE